MSTLGPVELINKYTVLVASESGRPFGSLIFLLVWKENL